MNTNNISRVNPHTIVNSLIAYLSSYDPYYPWVNYIRNTHQHYWDHLLGLIQNPNITEILTYYNSDGEYFTFNALQDELLAYPSDADTNYTMGDITFLYLQGLTFTLTQA